MRNPATIWNGDDFKVGSNTTGFAESFSFIGSRVPRTPRDPKIASAVRTCAVDVPPESMSCTGIARKHTSEMVRKHHDPSPEVSIILFSMPQGIEVMIRDVSNPINYRVRPGLDFLFEILPQKFNKNLIKILI